MLKPGFLALAMLSTLLAACGGGDDAASTASPSPASAPAAAPGGIPAFANVDQERLNNAANEPGQWLTYGGDYNEQRFSPLDQINITNTDQVGLAWYHDIRANQGQQSTPLFVDGVIYLTESWGQVDAIDATTGETRWRFDPQVAGNVAGKGCCGVNNRGAAVYEGKVFVTAYDGRMFALDAADGEVLWETQTVDDTLNYTSTGAVRVANGKVFIGNGGAEFRTRGFISALDANTGEILWRFHTVPGNPELGFENDAMRMAAETWSGNWWDLGGGGSTWDGITYDPETNLLLFGVGNGAPWNPLVRGSGGGDNLFLNSIVAVDADSGEYVWHYQQIPAEEWDFDSVQQITVADIEVDGEMRHVAMQAAKSGYYYMLDAYTGELIRANNFVPVNWTSGYDMATGRPNINEAAQYTKRTVATIIQPGPAGAHGAAPMSFSPETGLLYIPAMESSMAFTNAPENLDDRFNLGMEFTGGDYAYDDPDNTIVRGSKTRLVAWDPVAAEEVWAIEDVGTGGTLTTAGGLLIKGNGRNETLGLYNAEDGTQLNLLETQANTFAGAITYMHEGEQYIAQVVGGPSFQGYYAPTYARLLVYKLGGTETLPAKVEFTQRPFAPPEESATPELVAAGSEVYGENCAMCHDVGGLARSSFPDLRRSPMLHSAEGFNSVVLQGTLADRGMTSFAAMLTEDDTHAIRHFLIAEAHIAMNAPSPFGPPPDVAPEDVEEATQEN
jgi:PQQ-dependent dehydrogenase (methanol/ethanol family)